MAGKKRRTMCDKCKRLFQFGETKVTHKLKSITKFAIENRVFCSDKCLLAYSQERSIE